VVVNLPKCPVQNIKCEHIVRLSETRVPSPKSELYDGRSPFIAYSGADQQLDGEAPAAAADEPVLQRQHNSGVSVRGTPRPQSAACTSGEQLRPTRTPVLLLQVC